MNVILVIVGLIALLLFSSTVFRDIGLNMLLNPDALMIVLGGTIVAVFLGFPFKRLRTACGDIADTFFAKCDRERTSQDLLDVARLYRKADIRGLERKMNGISNDFLKLGVSLLITHQSNDDIRAAMERTMALRVVSYHHSQNVLKAVARLTPSFGLAGTVVSLIKMFQHMASVEAIAPHMGVAMMSTFYGVIIANLFMLPLSSKLEEYTIQSEALMHSTIDGIEAINNRDHPLRVQERVIGYPISVDLSSLEIGATSAATR